VVRDRHNEIPDGTSVHGQVPEQECSAPGRRQARTESPLVGTAVIPFWFLQVVRKSFDDVSGVGRAAASEHAPHHGRLGISSMACCALTMVPEQPAAAEILELLLQNGYEERWRP
jgi:hypothetical protein